VLSSLKKHLNEFELGNDYDENGNLNIASVAMNELILTEYYSIYPQGDDRILFPNKPIICCDLDDTVFKFREAYESKFNAKLSDYWDGDYNTQVIDIPKEMFPEVTFENSPKEVELKLVK
jgi:hypothetical protein